MKIVTTSIIILLSISNFAQQNYFNKRYNIGCGESAFKILQNANNFDIIGAATCLGPGLKNIFIRIDSAGNIIFHYCPSKIRACEILNGVVGY